MPDCSSSPIFWGSCRNWERTCSDFLLTFLFLDISSRTFHCYFKLYVLQVNSSTEKCLCLTELCFELSHGGVPASQVFIWSSVAICVCVVVFEQSFGQIIAFIYFNEYLFIKKIENVNTNELISVARNMDFVQIDTNCHDENGQSLSFVRCSLDLNWMVSDEIKASNQRTHADVGGVFLMMVPQGWGLSLDC